MLLCVLVIKYLIHFLQEKKVAVWLLICVYIHKKVVIFYLEFIVLLKLHSNSDMVVIQLFIHNQELQKQEYQQYFFYLNKY